MKYDYAKVTYNKKEYYVEQKKYSSFAYGKLEEWDPYECGLSYLKDKNKLTIEKLKFRKADKFTFSTRAEIDALKKEIYKIGIPIAAKEKKEDKARERKWALQEKAEAKKKLQAAVKMAKQIKLPPGVLPKDLIYSSDDSPTNAQRVSVDLDRISCGGYNSFKAYLVREWGWCIPTLQIARARRGSGFSDRAYAVRVSSGKVVRVGNGPHVEKTIDIFVKQSNFDRLRPLFALMHDAAVVANETRDRISTRMMSRRRYW